jgi:hypothetical protein
MNEFSSLELKASLYPWSVSGIFPDNLSPAYRLFKDKNCVVATGICDSIVL